jgi:hypothetical protein
MSPNTCESSHRMRHGEQADSLSSDMYDSSFVRPRLGIASIAWVITPTLVICPRRLLIFGPAASCLSL